MIETHTGFVLDVARFMNYRTILVISTRQRSEISLKHSRVRLNADATMTAEIEDETAQLLVVEIPDSNPDLTILSSATTGTASDVASWCMVICPLRALRLHRISMDLLIPYLSGSLLAYDLNVANRDLQMLLASCHQFRLHNSKQLFVALDCGSAAIIESCSAITFAKKSELAMDREPIQRWVKLPPAEAAVHPQTSDTYEIHDFDCVSADSANFSRISAEEWIQHPSRAQIETRIEQLISTEITRR